MASKCESVVFFVNSRVLGNHFLMLCRFYLYSCDHGWAVMSQGIRSFTYFLTARNELALFAQRPQLGRNPVIRCICTVYTALA